jgi:hypothetical protein
MALFEDHHQVLGSKLPVLCYPCLDPTRLDYQHYNNTKKSIKKKGIMLDSALSGEE